MECFYCCFSSNKRQKLSAFMTCTCIALSEIHTINGVYDLWLVGKLCTKQNSGWTLYRGVERGLRFILWARFIGLSKERPILGDHAKAHIYGFHMRISWNPPENLINQIIQEKLFSFMEYMGKAISHDFTWNLYGEIWWISYEIHLKSVNTSDSSEILTFSWSFIWKQVDFIWNP